MSNFLPKAQRYAREIPAILANRGLEPLIKGFKLVDATDKGKGAWLFVVMDEGRIQKMERYSHKETRHQISTALGGPRVILSNSTGLRYAILLSAPPALPDTAAFPGYRRGLIQFGIGFGGEVASQYAQVGHILTAGATRFGKSNLLRLISAQVLAEGHQAVFIDPQGDTWPFELNNHPQVLATGFSLASAPQALEKVMEEYRRRNQIVAQAREAGQTRPTFPQLFVFVDEFNGVLLNHGGERGEFATSIFEIAFGALKYGIHLVIGGHEFTKNDVGPMAGQLTTRICFKVNRPSIADLIVDSREPVKITTPGRALSTPFGWFQAYHMGDEEFRKVVQLSQGDGLTPAERELIKYINSEHGGRLKFEALQAKGFSKGAAARLRSDWVSRGLAEPAPRDNNTTVIVAKYRTRELGWRG